MDYFVYILFSEKISKFYVGTTDDVEQRLHQHNSGHYEKAFSTKGIPWNLFLSVKCESSEHAYKLEHFIKKMKSANFIRRIKNEPELLNSLLKKTNQ